MPSESAAPRAETTVCVKHQWRSTGGYDLLLPESVENFVCVKCGVTGQSDPMTGVVREDVVQRG